MVRSMQITQALAQAQARVADLQRQSRAAREHWIQLEVEVKEAQEEEEVLRRIAERNAIPIPGKQPPLPNEIEEWQRLDRTTAVERTLRSAGVPLTPKQITQALHYNGRDDDYHAVSAALAHLKKAKRAHQQERGQWVIWTVREGGIAVPDHPKSLPPGGPTGMELIERQLGGTVIEAIDE